MYIYIYIRCITSNYNYVLDEYINFTGSKYRQGQWNTLNSTNTVITTIHTNI